MFKGPKYQKGIVGFAAAGTMSGAKTVAFSEVLTLSLPFSGDNYAELVATGAIGPPAAMPANAFEAGDAILIIGFWDNLSGTGAQINTLTDNIDGTTGWETIVSAGNTTSDSQIGVFWKIASGGETTISYTEVYSGDTVLTTHRLPAGTFTDTNVVGTASAVEAASNTAPGITTTEANCKVLTLIAADGGDNLPFTDDTPSSPWTQIYSNQTIITGSGVACAVYEQDLAAAGASGDFDYSPSTFDGNVAVQFAIQGP